MAKELYSGSRTLWATYYVCNFEFFFYLRDNASQSAEVTSVSHGVWPVILRLMCWGPCSGKVVFWNALSFCI